MTKLSALLMMTVLIAPGARADVEPVVANAINGIAALNAPPTGKIGCAKAASAPGMDHQRTTIKEGNDKNDCDAYINDAGVIGDKGRAVEQVLNGSNPRYKGYADLLLGDKALFDDENSNGGVSFCPAFSKEMPKADRVKVYVKLLAELARPRSGCRQRTPEQDAKEGKAGEFRLPFKKADRAKYGRTFPGSQHHCWSNVSVGATKEGVLCALDMLAEQMKLKDKKEQAAEQNMDEKKKRMVGVMSRQSLFDELNPDKVDAGGEAQKRNEALMKAFEKFAPCQSK